MTKLLVVAALLLMGILNLPAVAAPAVIDLDATGVLDALERGNPTQYDKVQRIVAGVKIRSDAEALDWLRVRFDAKEVKYVSLWMVSYPPKRRLSFTLDETSYVTIITLDVQPRRTPAK